MDKAWRREVGDVRRLTNLHRIAVNNLRNLSKLRRINSPDVASFGSIGNDECMHYAGSITR